MSFYEEPKTQQFSVLFVGGIIWWAANTRGGAYPFRRQKASDPLGEDESDTRATDLDKSS